ncbi:MAG: UDP-3-O-(3-hydroxymyristoyl)glucosamine N-acyltransferase [Planctomycetes bacterium]|nr:UDP-3-O-(3-hydroxymyristoyl)glucosamine N-acyltransferase [Planctomycetota bacterium]
MAVTLAQLAELTGAALRGDPATEVRGVAGLHNARPGEVALAAEARYASLAARTAASALVVGEAFDPAAAEVPLLVAAEPTRAFEQIADLLCPAPAAPQPGVHPTAVVAPDAEVAPDATIQAHCVVESGAAIGAGTVLRPLVFVGAGARVGARCLLHPNVAVLDRCVVGDRVILHSGVVIGADGYGYETRNGVHHKLPQRGIVEVGDDVEIGANSTVDRARFGRTVIGAGTKIDNLVMVAHNVVVGEHGLLVAQCGIAGSAVLGRNVTVAAQAGIIGHIEVGDGAIVGGQAGVMRSVPPGKAVLGSPAQEIEKERQCLVLHQKLPDLLQRIRELAKCVEQLSEKVARLEASANDDSEGR